MAERGGRMANGFRMGRGIARRGARRDISGQVTEQLISYWYVQTINHLVQQLFSGPTAEQQLFGTCFTAGQLSNWSID